jgi:hypothetical protein
MNENICVHQRSSASYFQRSSTWARRTTKNENL